MPVFNRFLFGTACILLALFISFFATLPQTVSAQACTLNASDANGLISAINTANGNVDADTICLAVGTYIFTAINNSATDGANGLPVITSDISIEGGGVTLQRDTSSSAFRLFKIAVGGTLTLNNLTISNGTQNSGGVFLNLGTLNIENSTFTSNNATPTTTTQGGAVIFSTGTLNVSDSTFSSNTSAGAAGAMFVSGTNSITDVTFTQNQANFGIVYLSGGSINITRGSFIQNTSQGSGGYYQKSGTSTITDSVFDNNVGRIGAALRNMGGTMTISGTIIRNNHSDAFSQGPAIYADNSNTTISNSCITNNLPTSSYTSVYVNPGANLYAPNNWWGSSQGPLGGTNSYGGADSIYRVTDYASFLTAPILGCGWMSPFAQNVNPTTTYRTPVNFALAPRGGSPSYTYTILTNPTHGTLTGTAPDLTYTPAQFYVGSDSFTYQVTDSLNATSNIGTVSISVTSSLQATNQAFSARYAADIPFTLSATGGWSPYTFSNITTTRGTVTGTAPNLVYHPPANYLGNATIAFKVSDESGVLRSGSVVITTTWDLAAPTQSINVPYEGSVSITLAATGGQAPYTFSNISALYPVIGTLSGTPPNMVYTAPMGSSGITMFTFRVTDALGFTANGTIGLNIRSPLTATDGYTYVTPGTPVNAQLSSTGGIPVLTYTHTTPAHGVLTGTAPNLIYTMDAGYIGFDSFSYTVTDANNTSVTATRYFSSAPQLQAIDAIYNTPYEIALNITLSGTGGFTPYNFTIVTPPTHGTLTGSGINHVYTPNAGYSGSDSFTFRVTDSGGFQDTGTVNLTVGLPININDQTLTGRFDTPLAITAIVSGGVLPYTVNVSDPVEGMVTGTLPNLTYTPDSGFSGTDTFVITVTDALGRSDTGTITININTPYNVTDVTGLIAAINAANGSSGPDVILVGSGTYTVTAANNTSARGGNGFPVITSDITIRGSALIQRNHPTSPYRYFEVSSTGTLTIDGLTLNGGWGVDSGAAIYSAGNLQILNSTLSGNTAMTNGGAVYSSGVLFIDHSSFLDNHAAVGGAILTSSSSVTGIISFSTFSDNSSMNTGSMLGGGAIFSYTPLDIRDSVFTNNTTNNRGGALQLRNSSTIARSRFTNNTGLDGAVSVSNTVTITDSVFTDNNGSMGAVYAESSTTISGSCIVGNEGIAVYSASSGVSVIATGNWWGAADGPSGDKNGSGDAVSARVSVTPFRTTPLLGCGVLPPIIDTQTLNAVSNAGRAITLSARGGLPAYTYGNISTPAHGVLSGTAPNLTYTANTGYLGDDSFTFTATDSVGGTASGTVIIHVLAPLTAENFAYSVIYPDSLAITLTSNTGLPPFTFSDITQPAHGSVTPGGATVLYLPSETYGGTDTFTYRVTDSTGTSVINTVTITAGTPPSATIVVNSNSQEVPIVTNGNCTLGEAMRAAELNIVVDACPAGTTGMDIIEIPAGTYIVTAVAETVSNQDFGFPQMYHPVTLRGASAETTVIERIGPTSFSFFRVSSGSNVRIESMTLRNGGGNNTPNGGAIFSYGNANLNINNVHFEHNEVYNRGGAIFSYSTEANATLSIANSTFTDNHAYWYGGAIYHGQGGALTVTNTLFYNNNTDHSGNDWGNDLWSFSPVTLNYNCILGGEQGIYTGSTTTYPYSINVDWNWWGNADVGPNPLSERPSICNLVSIPTLTVPAGDTQALFDAIGYANTLPSATIELAAGSTYDFPTSYNGGVEGLMVLPNITGHITINGNGATLTRTNPSPSSGRFFYVVNNLTLNNLTVANGRATIGGAAFIYNGGSLTVVNTIFRDNTVIGVNGQGGAVALDGPLASFAAYNSHFENNSAAYGGAIRVRSGSITLTNSLFAHNTANSSGSSLSFEYQPTEAVIHDNCFTQNSGISIINSSTPAIDVTNNWWGAANGPSGNGSGDGDNVGTQLTFTPFLTTRPSNCPVSELVATNQNLSMDLSMPSLALTLSATGGVSPYSFSPNTPTNGTLSGTAPNLTYTPNSGFNGVDSFTFIVTDSEGITDSATVTVVVDTGVILVDTIAQEVPFVTNGNCTLGEAIQAANTDTAVDGCAAGSGADVIQLGTGQTYLLTLPHNTVSSVGNGLPQITSDITILGGGSSIIRDSSAPSFRIFYVETTGTLSLNNMMVSGGYLTGTSTSIDGGAGIQSRGTLTLQNVTLSNNNNSHSAGGALWSNTTVNVQNSVFRDNYAAVGAGAYVCNGTVNGTTFTANNATTSAALHHACGTMTVQNSIFTGNTATQGANTLFNNGFTDNTIGGIVRITITDSVFEGNTGGVSVIRNSEDDANAFQISNSCIVQAEVGFYNQGGANAVNAQNNWWGSVTGPGGLANGYGTSIQQSLVTYQPFLTTPIFGCDTFSPSIVIPSPIRTIAGTPKTIEPLQTVNGIAPFTYSIGTLPAHGTLTGSAPDTLVYTGASDYSGSDSFTVVVTDSRGRTTTNTIALVVVQPLVVNNQSLQTPMNTGIVITFTATGGTPGYTFTHGNPSHGIVTSSSNVQYPGDRVTYTPSSSFNGEDSFTYTVTDSFGLTTTATVTILVGTQTVNLALTQEASPNPIVAGQNLTYAMTVTNNGNAPATNVVMSNTLPTGVTFVSANASQGTGCTHNTGVVTCNLGTLNASSQASVALVVTPTTQNAALSNSASITSTEVDTNNTDNSASSITQVLPNALTLLSPSGTVNAGYGNPTYQWVDVPNAQYYYLLVTNSSGTQVINEVLSDVGYCNGSTCSIDATTLRESYRLANGTYSLYLNTWNGSTQGIWEGPYAFTLNATAPAVPTLEAPTNTNTARPTFNWTLSGTAANATFFNLVATPTNNPSAPSINQWFARAAVCGTVSSTDCALVSPIDLPNGTSYTVYLRSYGPGGISTGGIAGFAGPQNFTVDVPAPALPSGVTVNTNQGRATFTWNDDPNTVWFNLYVTTSAGISQYNNWHARADICTGGTCSVTPVLSLANGGYQVFVRAWGVGGFSTGGVGGYSQPVSFTFAFPTPNISEITTFSPSGSIVTGSPTFTWNTVAGTTYYLLWVTGNAPSYSPSYHQVWYDASAICSPHPGTCTVSNVVTLPVGNAVWRVQAYGTGGVSALHSDITLTVNSTLPPALTLDSPNGTITNPTPAFTWVDNPNVDWYNLYIYSSSASIVNQWYRAERGPGKLCDAGTCSLVIPGVTLANGGYWWNVRGYGPAGVGAWNASAPAFSVAVPVPSIPVQVTPNDGAVINTTNRPTFVWNTTSFATFYHLEVKNGMGTTIFDQWYQANTGVCTVSECTVQMPTPIAYGGYTWRVQAYSQGGLSAMSAPRSFFSLSVNPTPLMVQADSGQVARTGTWNMSSSERAVGQSFLNSSGSTADTLTFAFTGTTAEVVYLAGPGYGSFVIEVDGVAVRAVNANAAQDSVGNLASVSGLNAGQHTLRIVPLGGAPVAIDALIVDGEILTAVTAPVATPTMVIPTAVVTEEITPPLETTPVPTEVVPTAEPTLEPTIVPTEAPTTAPTVAPTETPTEVPTEVATEAPTDAIPTP